MTARLHCIVSESLITMRLFPTVLYAALALPSLPLQPLAAQSLTARPPATQATATADERSRALNKLFDEYWQFVLKSSPETATYMGDTRYNDAWSDYSAAAYNANLSRERNFITQLSTIDTAGLPEQQRISAHLLLQQLIDDVEGARFKTWQMPVNQLDGPQTGMPQAIAAMPFETVKDYDNYIARLNKVPEVFAEIQEAMSAGVDDGRTQPRLLMEQARKQVNNLATMKPEDSPYALPLKKIPASIPAAEQKRIRAEALDAITQKVLPSYNRFGRYLTAQYIPKARTDVGVTALPDGAAYYAYAIRRTTTLNKPAAEIHQIGLDEVKRDEEEMLVLAKKMGFNDLKSFNASIKANPKLHPTSPEQLLEAYRVPIAQMQTKLPQLFGRLPKAKVEVLPVPDYIAAQQAAAYYQPGTPDGKRPGQVFINTYHFADRGLQSTEDIAYHEGIPGHHLQIAIGQELEGFPEFRRNGGYTAFVEGWGLYAERLGKDVGGFQDPYSDYGRLESDIWRAIRLVVDTGLHSQHWTRQQVVDYFHDHSSIDETNVQAETDRYIAWPSQALGYKMGQLKILELRERAKTKLGAKFSLKNFHDEVLDSGALPLDVLEERVNAWIAAGGPPQS